MRFLTIFSLNFLLITNNLVAETIQNKSYILKQSMECIKDYQNPLCRELVSRIEELQITSFDQNRFKCQSSLLGLQSALIEAHYLKKLSNDTISLLIPYVIKNC